MVGGLKLNLCLGSRRAIMEPDSEVVLGMEAQLNSQIDSRRIVCLISSSVKKS